MWQRGGGEVVRIVRSGGRGPITVTIVRPISGVVADTARVGGVIDEGVVVRVGVTAVPGASKPLSPRNLTPGWAVVVVVIAPPAPTAILVVVEAMWGDGAASSAAAATAMVMVATAVAVVGSISSSGHRISV